MADRKRLSTKDRTRIFAAHGGLCAFCGGKIDGTRERWEVSHDIPLALGGADDATNWRPAHYRCHRDATAGTDIPAIAKAKRNEARHQGARAASRRPMPGGRHSPWKRTMTGEWVRR
jgi:5-methylcytosine-specific restriction protein A